MSQHNIGILGGQFDPIHFGHLHIANVVHQHLNLEQVLFVPTGQHPTKAAAYASTNDRWQMLMLALADNPFFEPSSIELNAGKPCRTIHTLTLLANLYPETNLFFILGSDHLADFEQWYQWQKILEIAQLAVVIRPGFSLTLPESLQPYQQYIHTINAQPLAISSSTIRQQLHANLPPKYLLPDSVLKYIITNTLYTRVI